MKTNRLLRNARIILECSCNAKPGETVLILADDALSPFVSALCSAAVAFRAIPLVVDVRDYLRSRAYERGFVLASLKAAIESADIVLENLADTWVANRPDFGRLTGDPDQQDAALTGERRWFVLQINGMDRWSISPGGVMAIRKRTLWLMQLLGKAKRGTVTSATGTQFTFGLGAKSKLTPILGIIPLYGEVAITPDLASTSGTFVVDGPTQQGVRPAIEIDRPPLTIVVERGKIQEIGGGDSVQRKRLARFISSGRPTADTIDEVGIVTTGLIANDVYYWSDGTHHHDRAHIALGNNCRRDVVVHGPRHMDCEICRPTITIDGLVVINDGVFVDKLWREGNR